MIHDTNSNDQSKTYHICSEYAHISLHIGIAQVLPEDIKRLWCLYNLQCVTLVHNWFGFEQFFGCFCIYEYIYIYIIGGIIYICIYIYVYILLISKKVMNARGACLYSSSFFPLNSSKAKSCLAFNE